MESFLKKLPKERERTQHIATRIYVSRIYQIFEGFLDSLEIDMGKGEYEEKTEKEKKG